MGVPVKLGSSGMEEIIQIDLQGEENAALQESAATVQTLVDILTENGYLS